MRKERALFMIGLWVAILPFLGFPTSWKQILFVITGGFIVYISYQFYQQANAKQISAIVETRSKTFVDNIGSGE